VTDGYDDLAWFYDRYWADRFHDAADSALQTLLFDLLPPGGTVIDLCCGSGHLTSRILLRGFRVIGIDRSMGMLTCARRRLPQVPLVCADASRFAIDARADAAVSTFDSMNHILDDTELRATFACVSRALSRGGVFVFDVNTDEAYLTGWDKSATLVEPDAALFIRGGYDPRTRVAETLITAFRLNGTWRRTDVRIPQRPLDGTTLVPMLVATGFTDVELFDAREAGMKGDIAAGRQFVRARRAA
jgi:SAM-dependent methyltransferase